MNSAMHQGCTADIVRYRVHLRKHRGYQGHYPPSPQHGGRCPSAPYPPELVSEGEWSGVTQDAGVHRRIISSNFAGDYPPAWPLVNGHVAS